VQPATAAAANASEAVFVPFDGVGEAVVVADGVAVAVVVGVDAAVSVGAGTGVSVAGKGVGVSVGGTSATLGSGVGVSVATGSGVGVSVGGISVAVGSSDCALVTSVGVRSSSPVDWAAPLSGMARVKTSNMPSPHVSRVDFTRLCTMPTPLFPNPVASRGEGSTQFRCGDFPERARVASFSGTSP
jgi:hypothetical protein